MADVQGTPGNDTLVGTPDDDQFHGNGGDDAMSGLAGNDIYYVEDSGDDIFENDGEGVDTVFALASYILNQGSFVEFLTADPAAGSAAINLTGNLRDNQITGNDGANILHGGGGTDLLVGLGGNDIYYTDVAATQVVDVVGAGTDALYTSVSYVLGGNASVELLSVNSHGATSAINLTGNYLDQTIVGNGGANSLHGGGGTDVLVGRSGDDTYYTDFAATQVVETVGGGTDALYTSVSYVLGGNASVELLSANSHAATSAISLTGNYLDQTISGNNGANILNGGGGTDILYGMGGDDIFYVDVAATKVIETDVFPGNDAVYASVSYVLAFGMSVETLSTNDDASTAAINLTGNNLDNRVVGNAGDNMLHGGGGTDVLVGRGGDDTYYTDVAATQIVERVGGGTDALYTSVSYVLGGNASIELFSVNSHAATSAIDLTGNYLDQIIVGNDGANVLRGGGGTDILYGMGGDDIFYVDVAATQVLEGDERPGTDAVYASVSYVLAFGSSVEILSTNDDSSTAAIDLTGNNMNNRIGGNAGDNILDGGASQDRLYGFGGNDTLLGGAGQDLLYGGEGDDSLRGGDGNDGLYGGLGNDTYYIEESSDGVAELAGEGIDMLYTELSYILPAGVEIEIVALANSASTATQSLRGNEFGNELRGSEGVNVLAGLDGNDILYGYGGNDILAGGEGLDTLHGGSGVDDFRFSAPGAANIDTIADFEAGIDKIGLNAGFGVTPAQLAAGAFRTGTAAADADDRIIYDSATGALYFDSDGVGGAAQIQFAFLTGAPPITAADFIT
jgi:serralysin